MAGSDNSKKASGKKSSSSGTKKKSSSSTKKVTTSSKAKKGNSKKENEVDYKQRSGMYDEIQIIVALAVAVLLLLSIYDLCGIVGTYISTFIFGLFGWIAYLLPYIIFFGTAFYISNRYHRLATVKVISGCVVVVCVMAFFQMVSNPGEGTIHILDFYEDSAVYRNGGGLVGGLICKLLVPLLGKAGAYLIIIALFLVSVVLFAGKSVFAVVLRWIRDHIVEASRNHKERSRRLAEAREAERLAREEERKALEAERKAAEKENKESMYETEADSDQMRMKLKTGKEDSVHMTEPENAFGEKLEPIGFKIPKVDDNFEFTPDPDYMNDGEGQIDVEAIERESKIEAEKRKQQEILFDALNLVAQRPQKKVLVQSKKGPAFEITERLPDVTPYLDDVEEDNQSWQYNMDLGIEKKAVVEADAEESVEQVPEHNEQPLYEDMFVKPVETPVIAAEDIQERTMEEKYTNLGEYTPNEEQISPAEAVRRAAGKAPAKTAAKTASKKVDNTPEEVTPEDIVEPVKEYEFPPIDLLTPGSLSKAAPGLQGDLMATAKKLQETLDSFGVKVQVTNVSCGPTVTRYELQPEQGVKVSKILSLTDDLKLNLAVADIRIEAPIPGKAAVGIEVPNKEKEVVRLRDLIESPEFQNHKSLIAFGAGRDIGGQAIIADIAKMPHVLIAGATGSGKSVCINTLIMSILYRAKPEDVRLIMIDPKVVELSVYNGIPHLLIPVVTDPKKAAGALNWAVNEMMVRYEKFAQLGVRDMKGYNAKIESVPYESEEHKKLPQIVIIVDELADLMMVASNEVEDAICRLAQLARAAGIHLVIATQRPSVNVITGLIKANVPSRMAFSVSSGVDSRTIIDMNGAEKLLGNGDMLFYPAGYQKPLRVQGSFVTDQEVNAVVEFLTKGKEAPVYNEAIINSVSSSSSSKTAEKASDDHDAYFVEAGKLIIEKDKASIGMLQRVYRIGFNRAARIMDQLCEAGVVGPEEGTKPRKVLMSQEQFEAYIDDYV